MSEMLTGALLEVGFVLAMIGVPVFCAVAARKGRES